MGVDGVWSSEILGVFGWEPVGIIVLNDGKAAGGGVNHYSTGTYKLVGGKLEIAMSVNFHGNPITVFGEKSENYSVKGSLSINEATLEGTVRRVDIPKQTIRYKLTKQADLP